MGTCRLIGKKETLQKMCNRAKNTIPRKLKNSRRVFYGDKIVHMSLRRKLLKQKTQ